MAGNKNLNLYAVPSVLLVILAIIANNIKESQGIEQNLGVKQNEVTASGALLDNNGALNERGWARRAVKTLEEGRIARLTPFRYKKWDFYSIFTQDLIIGTVITDLGHAGMGFLHIYDTKNNKKYYVNEEIMPWKKPHQPPETFHHISNMSYHGSNINLDFTNEKDEKTGSIYKTIRVSVKEPKIELSYVISRDADHEDIVTLTPMSEDSRYFFYNSKAYTYKVNGELKLEGTSYPLNESNAIGGQDLGRGTWPYNSFWLWASANGFHEGRRIGINLGGGFQVYNASQATEDSVFVNGKIVKLNVCEYKYNENSHENGELWSFITPTQNVPGSAKIYFEIGKGLINPKTTNYYFIKSELKQYYGRYRGEVIDQDGNLIKFDNIPGFAEVHRARW